MLDAAWPAGMVLVGAAAWQHPRPRSTPRAVADRGFLPVPLIAGLCATALLVLDHYQRLDQTAVWAAAACVARRRRAARRDVPRARADAAHEPPRGGHATR